MVLAPLPAAPQHGAVVGLTLWRLEAKPHAAQGRWKAAWWNGLVLGGLKGTLSPHEEGHGEVDIPARPSVRVLRRSSELSRCADRQGSD